MTESLGEYVRRKRLDARLTQTEVAGLVGTTQETLSRIERGDFDLHRKNWEDFCRVIPGVTMQGLAYARVSGGKPYPVPPEMLTPRQRETLVERMLSAEPVGAE